jgi:deoxyribose-phosphate aldolase
MDAVARRRVGCNIMNVSSVLEAPPSRSADRQATALVRAWVGRGEGIETMVERVGGVDQVGVEERVDSLKKRSIKRESKIWALDLAIRCMDLTTLEGADTPGKVVAVCAKAVRPDPLDTSIPSVAPSATCSGTVPKRREGPVNSG